MFFFRLPSFLKLPHRGLMSSPSLTLTTQLGGKDRLSVREELFCFSLCVSPSPCPPPPHLTSPRLASPRLTSPHLTSNLARTHTLTHTHAHALMHSHTYTLTHSRSHALNCSRLRSTNCNQSPPPSLCLPCSGASGAGRISSLREVRS